MKLPGFLSKPRWLSKDAETRRHAVLRDTDSELVANLSRLAREDADAGVRIAAMKRLADPGVAQGLAHDDADPVVRTQARALWLDLLTGTHAAAPALAERLRLLKAQDDGELDERIARRAPEAELRSAALARITRPATLFERALEDPDPAIRLALVERIDDETQLARLAERARKSDKNVNRRARERIDALRIARGDDVTVAQRARVLCERLEQLLREPGHAEAEDEIVARWDELEATVAEPLKLRFQAARQLLATSRNPAPPPSEPEVVEAMEAAAPTAAPAPLEAAADPSSEATATDAGVEANGAADSAPAASAEDIVAAQIAQARFAASLDEARAARKQKAERERALLAELEPALDACDAALESGSATQAHAAKARIDELRRRIDGALPAALARRFAATEARHAELSQWQHWADNQRRRQLCEEIEALATSGLHPDAIASRVREAQAEWTRLDAAEGGGPARAGGLARRFHGACRAAFAPAEAYFKKRQELRQSHGDEVTALLGRVTALAEDSADWPALANLRREIVEALRGLDRVEPRQRKALAQRLKDSLGVLDARVARRDAEVEAAKALLIGEAEALTQGELQRGAAATARELQQRWQRVGNGRRARDQAQWKAFRAAIDAVFAALDAARHERAARDAEFRVQAETLCAELEALAALPEPADRAAPARLRAAFDALRVTDPALQRRFETAQGRLRETAQRAERARRQARFTAWQARYRLCRSAETAAQPTEALRTQWQDAQASDIAADELTRRFDLATAADAATPAAASDDACRDVLVELEALAGVDSPSDDRERRRARQIDRLSARLGGGASSDAPDLAALLVRWSELGAAPDAAFDARLERALAAALDALP